MSEEIADHVFEVGDWFICLCSYGDCCPDNDPCEECLSMCNRYVVSGRHKTTNGFDYFFGGHYVAKDGSCLLTEPRCYVMTSDKDTAKKNPGFIHVSEARPVQQKDVRPEDRL